MRDDLSRLRDVIRAIDRIHEEIRVPPATFAQDLKLQVWVLYHLQISGEAARGLSADFASSRPEKHPCTSLLRNRRRNDLAGGRKGFAKFRETALAALRRLEAEQEF